MSKLFLGLCTLLAGFITVSGLASVKTLSDLPVHLAFLPITLYLVFTSINQIRYWHRAPEVTLRSRKLQLTILALMFIALTSLGLRAARYPAPDTSTPSSPIVLPQAPILPTPIATPPTLTVYYPDPTVLINIRQEPAASSALLFQTAVGSTYELAGSDSGWYQITLPGGTSGWIHSDYATTSATPL